ncbi:Uncharacterized protein FWK35_00020723 [Aphis craccivora]|uniref:Uncharacterized protein n=1 Tax=Aphis craccivora TaxID=307492 RepID=A0A6G0XWV5_APHCR|nr:Uncharacterized protein FWK35_00020723 [Aphis craccivora]
MFTSDILILGLMHRAQYALWYIIVCKNDFEEKRFVDFSNSERSDECIDLTMIITSRNNAPISNFGGGLRCKSEYPWCIIQFKNKREKQKKSYGKTGIFTQNQFSTKSIFLYGCNSKTNHSKYLKFSPNVYVSVIYIHVDKKIFSNFHEICRKRENLQDKNYNTNISRRFLKILPYTRKCRNNASISNFEVQILTKICQIPDSSELKI